MTQPTQHTYVTPLAGRLHPVTPPAPVSTELESVVEEYLPKLRIWASYPDGSSPESVEVTYDADGPVTVELIAGILRSLPGQTTHLHLTGSDIKPEALTRALSNANRSLKGTVQ